MNLPNNYSNIHIVCYPGGSGGNFLINCLALSDDCVLPDAILARKQLQGGFSSNDKAQYFKEQLEITRNTGKWNDLSLGHQNFFGVRPDTWVQTFPEYIALQLDPVVRDTIDQKKTFFINWHHIVTLDKLKIIWPRSKIIVFNRYRGFLDTRYNPSAHYHPRLLEYWNKVRDAKWPLLPPRDLREFQTLPTILQTELKIDFGFGINRWFDHSDQFDLLWQRDIIEYQKKYGSDVAVWTVDDSYDNVQNLLSDLMIIYDFLHVQAADQRLIEDYFCDWRETLGYLSGSRQKI